jgi:hypothetical protein
MPRGLKIPILFGWLIVTPVLLVASLYQYSFQSRQPIGVVLGTHDGPYALFSAPPPFLNGVSQSFGFGDARSLLIEKFLHSNRSPMQGSGDLIVAAADKYGIDWRLSTAIAFQESNLGKVIPKRSFNAWGWAIYTGQDSGASFMSWPDAIEKVSRGLAREYYARGLRTPKQIQTRYTPGSDGSWADGVQQAMDAIND